MIPYTGGMAAITALLGGHVTAESGSSAWTPYVKEGTLRLLATHGEKRMKIFPNVPTLKDLGYDFVGEVINIVAAPKGTPPAIVKRLYEAFCKATDDPEFIQLTDKLQIEPTRRTSEETDRYLKEAYARFGKMIIDLKIPREDEKK
jgi:tripartite-type tricarboxylate transporter receptor subunit TctC